jgi:16S rRNA (cytosine1402-N4)-methyltransferase
MKNRLSEASNLSVHKFHKPVLLKEVVELLKCSPGKIIVDGTVGSGGHSIEILKKILPGGTLIGIDLDDNALERARQRLSSFEGHFKLYRENYKNLAQILKKENIKLIDGFFLDLGLSSEQVEDASRGFSFLREGPLDMRYDAREITRAIDVINKESREKLTWIFSHFGEERKAASIAGLIIEKRKERPIETTLELTRIAARAKAFSAKGRISPATRIFQALRIYINKELENLETALGEAIRVISAGGRFCVLSYHSMEDRLVKNFFKDYSRQGRIKIITRHTIAPSREEILENRRSRSAKLRAVEII